MQFLVNIWNAQRNAKALFDAGMDSEAIHNIRQLLKANNVPAAAFVDDHVANAVVQRDQAKAEVMRLTVENAALRSQINQRGAGGKFTKKSPTE
jgi:hypothetical protein